MGSTSDVKKFGEQMVKDHTGVNKSAVGSRHQAEGRAGGQPDRDELEEGRHGERRSSEDDDGQSVRQRRTSITRWPNHEQVLEAIDKTLIPPARRMKS